MGSCLSSCWSAPTVALLDARQAWRALNLAWMVAGQRNTNAGADQGVTGPKFLGARELTYRLAFIASSTQVLLWVPALQPQSSCPWPCHAGGRAQPPSWAMDAVHDASIPTAATKGVCHVCNSLSKTAVTPCQPAN